MSRATLRQLTEIVLKFRDERDWKQFHSPKDLALDLCVESAEAAELFLWRGGKDLHKHLRARREQVADELADVLHVLLLLADDLEIDLGAAFVAKMKKNEKKYPVHKSKGVATKYTEL